MVCEPSSELIKHLCWIEGPPPLLEGSCGNQCSNLADIGTTHPPAGIFIQLNLWLSCPRETTAR